MTYGALNDLVINAAPYNGVEPPAPNILEQAADTLSGAATALITLTAAIIQGADIVTATNSAGCYGAIIQGADTTTGDATVPIGTIVGQGTVGSTVLGFVRTGFRRHVGTQLITPH